MASATSDPGFHGEGEGLNPRGGDAFKEVGGCFLVELHEGAYCSMAAFLSPRMRCQAQVVAGVNVVRLADGLVGIHGLGVPSERRWREPGRA